MNLLVCGGRDFAMVKQKDHWVYDKELFNFGLSCVETLQPTKIVTGGASGADDIGRTYALKNNVDYEEYLPDWDRFGRSAGPIRNSEMLRKEDIDLVLAFPGGRGTTDMINKALKQGIRVYEIYRSEQQYIRGPDKPDNS